MDSKLNSQVDIKDEMFEDWNVLHDSSVDETDTYEEVKLFSLNVMKQEEPITVDPLPEPFISNSVYGTVQIPALFPCPNVSTRMEKRQEVTPRKSGLPHDLLLMKKLLQLTLPKKHVCSRWTKQTTESILRFLKSFLTLARGSRLTHSADRSLALKGPRILKCEDCLVEFSGLYDRYLKLFIHYKTDHRLKCNMLIGRKWIKQKASLDIMVQAWKMDLKYELQNMSSPCISNSPTDRFDSH